MITAPRSGALEEEGKEVPRGCSGLCEDLVDRCPRL